MPQTEGAVCALTGVRVTPVEDPDEIGHGLIQLTFPGAAPIEAIGSMYLRLKIIESVRLEFDSAEHGDTKVSRRAQELSEHFDRKYDL